MQLHVCLLSLEAVAYSIRAVFGAVDGDNPLVKVGFRGKVNFHVFRRLRLQVRKLLDLGEHGVLPSLM